MNGQGSVTAPMAIRFGKAFGTTPQYWLNLQVIFELKQARAKMPDEALSFEPYVAA